MASYVGDELMDVLARVVLGTEASWDSQLHVHNTLLAPHSCPIGELLPAPDAPLADAPVCEEATLAAEVLEGLPASPVACTAEERGYKPRPKKGKPIDRAPVLR